ncbi:MAG: phage tail protein [bacterium]|nr:phage tail protein [bacterium]
MSAPSSRSGRQLYALLPEVYRSRDGGQSPQGDDGDLAKYLDACGEFLDQVRNTLDQRLADCFPDRPPAGRAAQDWLLPYLAQLLDARLLSPHVEGRRREVGRAIAWRQRKGTRRSIEEIAEAVGQLEVEVQEGWQRVAVTPRLGMPLVPEPALDMGTASQAARHPGLPAATPDFRQPLPQAHGIPRFPGSWEDTTRRTVDLRSPSWSRGHHHPRRLLLFAPPPTGFFPPDRKMLAWRAWHEPAEGPIGVSEKDGVRRIFHPDPPQPDGRGDKAISVEDDLTFNGDDEIQIEDLNFLGTLRVTRGRLKLRRVAVRHLVIESGGEPALDAVDCLFETVTVNNGLARLEYCTVLDNLSCQTIQASDCIFGDGDDVGTGCIRYSRLPSPLAALQEQQLRRPATTTVEPTFFSLQFGEPGCGVLHPATPESIRFGAEDGGEMGAFHRRRYCLQEAAVLEKLLDFLPLGITAVLIPDPRLPASVPESETTDNQ